MTDRRCVIFDEDLMTSGATLTAGPGDWARPAAALQSPALLDCARFIPSPEDPHAVIEIDFGRRRSIAGLALLGVVLDYAVTAAGFWRVTFYEDAGGAVLAQWPPDGGRGRRVTRAFATRTRPISTPNWWSGRQPARDTALLLDRPVRAAAVRVEIDPEGAVLDVGRLWIGGLVRTAWGIDWGRRRDPGLQSAADPLPGGGAVFDRRLPQRRQDVAWRELSDSEADRMTDLLTGRDRVDPWLIIPDPGAGPALTRDMLYGRITPEASPAPSHVGPGRWQIEVPFVEVLE